MDTSFTWLLWRLIEPSSAPHIVNEWISLLFCCCCSAYLKSCKHLTNRTTPLICHSKGHGVKKWIKVVCVFSVQIRKRLMVSDKGQLEWKKMYFKLCRCYPVREQYSETLHFCTHCHILFWKVALGTLQNLSFHHHSLFRSLSRVLSLSQFIYK